MGVSQRAGQHSEQGDRRQRSSCKGLGVREEWGTHTHRHTQRDRLKESIESRKDHCNEGVLCYDRPVSYSRLDCLMEWRYFKEHRCWNFWGRRKGWEWDKVDEEPLEAAAPVLCSETVTRHLLVRDGVFPVFSLSPPELLWVVSVGDMWKSW